MPSLVSEQVEVSVPATSANLGPGFDALGLAVGLRDRVTARVVDSGARITVSGSGSDSVPLDETHLVYAAMQRAFAEMDCDLPGIALHCVNAIPHGRGLGSSSAAIVAGICAARGLVSRGAALLDDEAVLCLAACMEGHPDNVAPALLGGFTVAWSDKERHHATRIGVDPRVSVVVFVPPEAVETRVARGYLPANVTHDDAAANAGRAALLVAALSGAPELLLPATEDLLHQRFRQPAMPSTLALVHALRADGVPAVISGAGPSVLAFTEEPVDAAVRSHAPDGWEVLALPVDHDGARVTVR